MEELTDLQEKVTKEGGTEPAFNNGYWDNKEPGIYVDVNTGKPLFSSQDKYDSGTGWPSFTKPINDSSLKKEEDSSFGVKRMEVRTDESHLGHVFDDGPDDGERYCINSAALKFIHYKDLEKEGYEEYKELFKFEIATLGGGCFWGVEHLLQQQEGIANAVSGYMGGDSENPTYKEVSSGNSGYYEVVQIEFDQEIITYEEVLDVFWRLHDPTQEDRQGPDRGKQYGSVIFYHSEEQKEIAETSKENFDSKNIFNKLAATKITFAKKFYKAEDYHQDYYEENSNRVCHTLRDE